jgi:hypothetical protein
VTSLRLLPAAEPAVLLLLLLIGDGVAWRQPRAEREREMGGGTRSLFIMVVLRKAAVLTTINWARVKED